MRARGPRMDAYTPLIVVVIPLALGFLDILLYKFGGNEATISVAMLHVRVKHVVVAWVVQYTFGVFYSHCFMPSPEPQPPPTHIVLAWFVVGMAPTFSVLIIIFSGDGERVVPNHVVLDPVNQVKFAAVSLLFQVAGLLVGRMVLRQHPLAMG